LIRLVHADAKDVGAFVSPSSVELAYLDPPFAVGARFTARTKKSETRGRETGSGAPVAYDDRWPSLESYLTWLEVRVAAVRDTLADTGTMWLHLDHRAVHEAKGLCDRVFGKDASIGEVIWVPGNGTKTQRGPGAGHQTLLLYAKTTRFIWNAKDPALRAPFAATSLAMHFQSRDEAGRAYRDRTVKGKTYRYYADEGRALGSVWTDCPAMVANTPIHAEGTGYPTQKPLKLLERIVRASSRPGSLVLDPFCGSGTTLCAAARLGREAVGMDIGALAVDVVTKRARGLGLDLTLELTLEASSAAVDNHVVQP
jgi:site-specific DNA-methyltransferase (adenine-specific)